MSGVRESRWGWKGMQEMMSEKSVDVVLSLVGSVVRVSSDVRCEISLD